MYSRTFLNTIADVFNATEYNGSTHNGRAYTNNLDSRGMPMVDNPIYEKDPIYEEINLSEDGYTSIANTNVEKCTLVSNMVELWVPVLGEGCCLWRGHLWRVRRQVKDSACCGQGVPLAVGEGSRLWRVRELLVVDEGSCLWRVRELLVVDEGSW